MTTISDVQRADYLSRRRARVLPGLVVIYLSQQISYFSIGDDTDRAVDQSKVVAWVILSLLLLANLATRGFWFHRRELRDLIDDESAQANRLDAMRWGLVSTICTAVALYFLQQFEPVTVREAIHTIVSLGLGVALLRFAHLERRAHRA